MKKIIMLFLLMLSSIIYAQQISETTPRFYTDEAGNTFVLLTVAQAQKLDNDGEILKLFTKLNSQYVDQDKKYLIVINDLEQQIGVIKVKMKDLESNIVTQKVMIKNLNDIISSYDKDALLVKKELENKDAIILNLHKDVRKLKWQRVIGVLVSLLSIGFLIAK